MDECPRELALVRDFVNTLDIKTGRDQLHDGLNLGQWLRKYGLAGRGQKFHDKDAARARAFREALRALLRANNGSRVDSEAVARLAAEGTKTRLTVTLDRSGSVEISAAGGKLAAVFGRLLGIIARAQAQESWHRLKACGANDCQSIFYDHSRNQRRNWCDMGTCGNRAKARSFRERNKIGAPNGQQARR